MKGKEQWYQLSAFIAGGIGIGFALTVLINLLQASVATLLPLQLSAMPPDASDHRVFTSKAALMLKFVKPSQVDDFEATIVKLNEALRKSPSAERRQQAAGLKVFKASETASNGDVIYVFDIDPVVEGADYTISNLLAEELPTERGPLYQAYARSSASHQNVLNLNPVPTFEERPGNCSAGSEKR